MVSPGNPTQLQSHLYFSFLHGETADVQLCVKGHWEAVYQLHRVVLIQAGFFRSLFTAGFLESNRGIYLGAGPNEVTIRFDDENITRSAFEICVARLYGGGPDLSLSPLLVPTTACPLTPSFQSPGQQSQTPPGQHPATPRFLLSLLATSIYLSIPSITSHALSMVLNSVGPYTVHRYLSFAIGYGIGLPEDGELLSAVGLENVGKEVDRTSETAIPTVVNSAKEDGHENVDAPSKLSSFESETNDGCSSAADAQASHPRFDYGKICSKIGESSVCWLTRWGADIFLYEEAAAESRIAPGLLSRPEAEIPRHNELHSLPPDVVVPCLWAKGGLTAPWIRAIISSDDFFIKGEWERYDFARRVVDLRRRQGVDPEEEEEWLILFQQGIHYTHMLFEDLVRISQDISPVTGQPYVPIDVIHAAHWTQSLLKHQIITRSPVNGNSSPSHYRDRELGITLTTADILAIISSEHAPDSERAKPYYPVSFDTSQRIGDTENASDNMEKVLDHQHDVVKPGHTPADQAHFFGILARGYTASSCIQMDTTGKARWSHYPPVRFAIEFWGADALPEKSRLYSRTVWYAGSLFNVYVQVVRKKGLQLGLYLHRQSTVDPIPQASAPPMVTRADRAPGSSTETSTQRPQTPVHSRARSPTTAASGAVAVPGSPISVSHSATTTTHLPPSPVAPLQPYRDPRPVICAHFTISCASPTGSSLTRFSSKPDQFVIGQSWGWKSSTLLKEEYIDMDGGAHAPMSKESSLRATVVLGLI